MASQKNTKIKGDIMQNNQDANTRKVIRDCSASEISNFILAIEKGGQYSSKKYVPVSDKSHLERFNYFFADDKVSIVFDTKAMLLSITAKNEIVENLESIFSSANSGIKKDIVQINTQAMPKTNEKTSKNKSVSLKTGAESNNCSKLPEHLRKQQKVGAVVKLKTELSTDVVVVDKKQPKVANQKRADNSKSVTTKKSTVKKKAESNKIEMLPYKNGYANKNCDEKMFNDIVANLRNHYNADVNLVSENEKGLDTYLATYEISDKSGNKLNMRYMPSKKALALQGKNSSLYLNMQMIIAYGNSFVGSNNSISAKTKAKSNAKGALKPATAITKPKEKSLTTKLNDSQTPVKDAQALSGGGFAVMKAKRTTLSKKEIVKTADVGNINVSAVVREKPKKAEKVAKKDPTERKLQKLIPNAFEFLSEQSIAYLISGYKDLNNRRNKLSDYSTLLVSPFKALESLIYSLQVTKNINVKMIGQGFDRNEKGEYCLKSGYHKKIDSVVYNEALSSLYTQYSIVRNFYTHADNSEQSQVRVITEQKEAQEKFTKIIELMDYNCKKLKEIGFSIIK